MEKFLKKREVVSLSLCTGEAKVEKKRFLKKIATSQGGYHHELPNGEKHGTEIIKECSWVDRTIYKNGKMMKIESFGPSQDWNASYKNMEYRQNDQITITWNEGGVTNFYKDEKIGLEVLGGTSIMLWVGKKGEFLEENLRDSPANFSLEKGSIEYIIAKNFLESFDL
uniref:MORN repeat containing protein n=1 Tax=Marseillevirus sp. TaxID=2809551 RepID=A0AA96IY06_9VIRU|nr:MORN repeat containing protein [Marseillevirus sp.]